MFATNSSLKLSLKEFLLDQNSYQKNLSNGLMCNKEPFDLLSTEY